MGRNLGPLNIKDSYEGLVQISGSSRDTLTDGSGSVITNLNVSASYATTASFALNVVPSPTGSFMVTGSIVDATSTFTKGDGSVFTLTVDNVANAVSASHAVQADSALTATSASHAIFADTAGAATDVNALYTASVVDATISFLKGGGGTFPITIDNVANAVSASYATTASFALTASSLEGGVSLQTVLDTGNTATEDIILTGSINVVGNIKTGDLSNSVSSTDTAVIGGSGNSVSQTDSVIAGGVSNNIQGDKAFVGGGSNHTINSAAGRMGILGGQQNSITAGEASAIVGSFSSTLSSTTSAIVAGRNHTNSHLNSVVIGGDGLSTIKDNEVVVPDLSIYGDTFISSSVLGTGSLIDNLGQQALPGNDSIEHIVNLTQAEYDALTPDVNTLYVISGSTGGGGAAAEWQAATAASSSVSALNNTPSQIDATSPYSLLYSSGSTISSQDGGWNVALGGYGQVISGNGYGSSIIGGINNSILENYLGGIYNSNGSTGRGYASIIMGAQNSQHGNNNVNYSGIYSGRNHNIQNCSWGAILGGSGNTVTATNSAVAGGESNQIVNGDLHFIGGGGNAQITGNARWSGIIGGFGNILSGGQMSFIGGGRLNQTSGASQAFIGGGESHIVQATKGAIIGGNNNTVASGHNNSVVIGGDGLTTTKTNEVVVPSLTIKGQVIGDVNSITIASTTGSIDCSTGNFFDLTLAATVDTHLVTSNITAGQTISLFLKQDPTTAGTISFSSDFLFEGGTAFTASTGLGAKDVMTFISDGVSLFATGLKNFS